MVLVVDYGVGPWQYPLQIPIGIRVTDGSWYSPLSL